MTLVKPLLVSFSLLAFTAAGYANESSNASSAGSASAGQSSPSSQQQGQMRTSELIGSTVRDSQGKEIGEIEDVVLDLQRSRVHAAVLSFGGIMGIGEKHFAFPVGQLKPGKGKNQFTMNIDKQKLETAQGFEQRQWPAMDDEYWGRVGGQASAGATKSQGKPKMALVRASELDGKSVKDKSGQDVGEIQDVVVDMKSGQLRNIVIDVDDGGQARVQAKALTKGTGDELVLNMSAEQLKRQAKQPGSGNQGMRNK
jgi:sporulation protein YlmC with PRC-barrel domain